MIEFAKLNADGLVIDVSLTSADDAPDEAAGIAYLSTLTGHANWRRSYPDGSARWHPASVGATYRKDLDAFVPQQPFPSWVLDQTAQDWIPPVPMPVGGGFYIWDETQGNWSEQPPGDAGA